MRKYFLHYLDGEHVLLLGDRTCVLARSHLKLLALLGARVSVSDIMLLDSKAMQLVAADPAFRKMLDNDPRFLQLEARPASGTYTGEPIARRAFERVGAPNWISSSGLDPDAMRGLAEVTVKVGLANGSDGLVRKLVEQRAFARFSDAEQRRLKGVLHLFGWFATEGVTTCKPDTEVTFHHKLDQAFERLRRTDSPDLRRLVLARDFVVGEVGSKAIRSDVVTALKASGLPPAIAGSIRCTVASAWSAAVADGLTATVAITRELPHGVPVSTLTSDVVEHTVRRRLTRAEARRLLSDDVAQDPSVKLAFNPDTLSWKAVAKTIRDTESTRRWLVEAADSGRPARPGQVRAHIAHLNEKWGLRGTVQETCTAFTLYGLVGGIMVTAAHATGVGAGFTELAGAGGAGAALALAVAQGGATAVGRNLVGTVIPRWP